MVEHEISGRTLKTEYFRSWSGLWPLVYNMEVVNMKNTEFLNKMIKYWQDLVYYYLDTEQFSKYVIAKKQLEGYKNAYYNA